MFERFTPKAIKAVMLAQYEAVRFGLAYISTEELLLGLLAEEQGVAARAMQACDMDYAGLSEAVAEAIGKALPGDGVESEAASAYVAPGLHEIMEFTAQAQVALEDACELAQAADSYVTAGTQPRNALTGAAGVDTEHILLALLKSEHCPAAEALAKLGVDKVKLKSQVLNLSGQST